MNDKLRIVEEKELISARKLIEVLNRSIKCILNENVHVYTAYQKEVNMTHDFSFDSSINYDSCPEVTKIVQSTSVPLSRDLSQPQSEYHRVYTKNMAEILFSKVIHYASSVKNKININIDYWTDYSVYTNAVTATFHVNVLLVRVNKKKVKVDNNNNSTTTHSLNPKRVKSYNIANDLIRKGISYAKRKHKLLNGAIYYNFRKFTWRGMGNFCYLYGIERHVDTVSHASSFDEVKKDFENSEGYSLISTSSEYKNSHEKLTIECPQGHTYKASKIAFKNGNRCPICMRESSGERAIRTLLSFNNIDFYWQYPIDNPFKKGHLFYDFIICIKGHVINIEYNGEQHYNKENPWYSVEGKNRDLYKKDYAISRSWEVIHIDYTEDSIYKVYKVLSEVLELSYPPDDFIKTNIRRKNKPSLFLVHDSKHEELEEEALRYYRTHSSTKTSGIYSKFNNGTPIPTYKISKVFKYTYGMTKREYLKQHPEVKS